jgi:hypothetical protein
MAGNGSRVVRGWRGRLDDLAAEIRDRLWSAPATTVYLDGVDSASSDNLLGHTRWFKRVFGQERAIAVAELRELRNLRRRIRRAEFTEEQREKEREWQRNWRATRSDEWRANQATQKRKRMAAKPELYREIDKRTKAKHRDAINERRREARRDNIEACLAYERAKRAARRERTRELARAAYARNKAKKERPI